MRVAFTVDMEPDCPPYLRGWRGMEEGAPRLMALLDELGVPATCFTTGTVAERFPGQVASWLAAGHELGCHGWSHRALPDLGAGAARDEIRRSADLLRSFAPVSAFRAPYLRFPEAWLGMLEAEGFRIDASRGRYKPAHRLLAQAESRLMRVEASVTSSVLRLPGALRDPWLRRLSDPVVLFVHPWEFVDLTRERLRWDCRFATGAPALEAVRRVLALFGDLGGSFVTVSELGVAEAAPGGTAPGRREAR